MGKTGSNICFLQLFRLVNFPDALQYLLQLVAFFFFSDGMTGRKRCKRAVCVCSVMELYASDSQQ